jgi:hypothetical protein
MSTRTGVSQENWDTSETILRPPLQNYTRLILARKWGEISQFLRKLAQKTNTRDWPNRANQFFKMEIVGGDSYNEN